MRGAPRRAEAAGHAPRSWTGWPREDEPDLPALHGWRREVFGEDALALKSGRITLGVDGKRVKLVRV